MRVAEVPSLGIEPANYAQVRRSRGRFPWLIDRRQFIRATIGMGMSAGIMALSVFPAARRARASHVGSEGYEIYIPNNLRNCDLGPSGPGTCAEPCGPSKIHTFACHPDQDHKAGYHKDTGDWALRPNRCDGTTGLDPDADGWRWEPAAVCPGGCDPAQFRCHDGWHRHAGDPPDPEQWHPSVCSKRVFCG